MEKNTNNNTKTSQNTSETHTGNEDISRISSTLTYKNYAYLNLQVDHVYASVERTFDDCTKYFQRFKYKCVFVIKIFHQTHGTTSYFTLSNNLKNQHEEVNEANELGNQNDEFEQGESGNRFDSITKVTRKIFKYHDIRASSYCNLPKLLCNSKSLVNIQNDDKYCFMRSILAHKHKMDNHHEIVSRFKQYFYRT